VSRHGRFVEGIKMVLQSFPSFRGVYVKRGANSASYLSI
jgi:hypothetical protein